MAIIVVVDENGAFTLPEEVRRALGLEGEATFDAEFDPVRRAIVLRLILPKPHGHTQE